MHIVENVPCLECDSCDEQYFAIAALNQIDAGHAPLSTRRERPCRVLKVPAEE
jgi:hypothetical protein